MKWLMMALAVIAFVLWGIPAIKYAVSRLWILLRLITLRITHRCYFVFRSPLSLFAFNHGKHADLLIVSNDRLYVIKFGGSFKRATIIVAHSPTHWRFHRFTRTPSHTAAFIIEPTQKDVNIRFDIVRDTVTLRNTVFRKVTFADYTPVYMLSPKPLNISAVEGDARQLSNADEFFGMTLFTAKHFFNICRQAPVHYQHLSKEEKALLKRAFRSI